MELTLVTPFLLCFGVGVSGLVLWLVIKSAQRGGPLQFRNPVRGVFSLGGGHKLVQVELHDKERWVVVTDHTVFVLDEREATQRAEKEEVTDG